MSKSFEVNLRILVHDVDDEAEEYLREDTVDFLAQADLFDDADITITEVS